MHATPYLDEVRRRAAEAESRASAALADLAAAEAVQVALPAFTADVRDASELSVAECREQYVARFRPLLIRSIGALTDPTPWTLAWLREHCGQKCAAVNVGGSQMAASCEVAGVEVMTIDDLAQRIEARSSGRSAYLYDCSLPLKLPALCERLAVPVYFAHDWLQRTRRLHAFSRSWPSLFVGATGTRSSLHIDQWKGHFWMAQLCGAHSRPALCFKTRDAVVVIDGVVAAKAPSGGRSSTPKTRGASPRAGRARRRASSQPFLRSTRWRRSRASTRSSASRGAST
mmetsp:Transcript_36628/g.119134  ORF Transcript_36628/g.119134 Transcript_36628/m.119134 type:complete len:286 (-) Transcript_36628:384-1241(-)